MEKMDIFVHPHLTFPPGSAYYEMDLLEKAGAASMDTGQGISRWFRLTGEAHVEIVDKFSGGNVHPDRVMAQWVLVLMINGTRTFHIYGEDHVVHSGEFFLLPPYVRHYGLQYDQHEAYFAHFQAEGAESPPPAELDPGHILLPLWGQVPLELSCFDLMEYAACHRAPPFFSESFLSSQIQAILYQLSLAMQKKKLWSNRENRMALRILRYIDNNKGRQLQNQDYAAAFGRTYRHLNAIFQTVYGVTIKQMQGILRVDQAKRMLSSGHTISETSAACGFEDYFYFLKVFKSKTGMTPSQYQEAYPDTH